MAISNWIYDKATNVFLYGGFYDAAPTDANAQGVAQFTDFNPDTVKQRFDPAHPETPRDATVDEVLAAKVSGPVPTTTFMKLVTDAEWATFQAAAAPGQPFARAFAVLNIAPTITPSDGYFVQMMSAAVAAGILTQARHDAIMAALTS